MTAKRLPSAASFVVSLALCLVAGFAAAEEPAAPALSVQAAGRTAFLRMEADALVGVEVSNPGGAPLQAGTLTLSMDGREDVAVAIPALEPGESFVAQYPMDTALRPGEYSLRAIARAAAEGETLVAFAAIPVHVVARPIPHRMPVFMWGTMPLDHAERIGFTHVHYIHPSFGPIWRSGEPVPAHPPERVLEKQQGLNEILARSLRVTARASAMRWPNMRRVAGDDYPEHMERVDREGNRRGRHLCGQHERLREFCYNAGVSMAQTYGAFPAMQLVNIQPEQRDHSELCFCDLCKEAYRAYSGQDIPAEARSKSGVSYENLEGFPEDRVIPDDHPVLRYYRWFWREGDGWDRLHTAVHEGIKTAGRDDLLTFYAPATRGPSYYGQGGDVDIVFQWTYTHPDPTRVGLTADELFALAAPPGRPAKQVYQMTQLFTKRSYIMPSGRRDRPFWDAEDAPFADADPDAAYMTITPDQLRGAFWAKIARPVQGIAYHGFESLVPVRRGGGYRFTHPDTQDAIQELICDVVQPLGATLTQVPDPPKDVAFLQSFTSQMLARRGAFGWGFRGWETDAYLALLHAQLQPEIIYDETVTARGLDGYKVLAMFHCDVLTESVANAVKEFQRNGGIVIGDEFLAPAITPDILVRSAGRSRIAERAKAMILEKAAEIRAALDAAYLRRAESSDPDVLVRLRRYNSTDYVFVVNDRRTYGDYLGHHRWVMEKGLPAEATLTLRRDGGAVYDLVGRRTVEARQERDGRLRWDVQLGPGEGRVFMVVDRPVAEVKLDVPETAQLGSVLPIRATVLDAQGNPMDAVVPVQVEIRDRLGRDAEFAGYHGAKDGQLEIPLELAPNDAAGVWWVSVRELASGKRTARLVDVAGVAAGDAEED